MERQEKPTKPVPLFLSYAYEDELLLRELEKHLHLLKQLGLITLWHRRQIVAGTDWAMVIDEHLEQAALILLLISPDYLASTYSRDEMQRALELHEQKRAWVLPILLRQVDLQGTDLSKLKPLPTNEKPIMKWSKRDEAFCDITRSLRQIIAGLSVSSHTGLLASQQSPSGSGSRDDHVKVPLVNTSWPHAEYDQTELPLPANVFCFNQQLLTPKEFYGRARERMVLQNRTQTGASTSIVGPRRIGKTWLLHYLQLTARQELGSRFLIKYLDVTIPRCATVTGFTGCVIEELLSQKRTFDQGHEGLVALEQVIQDFSRRHQVIVLCIDEFEGFGNHQEFDLNFFTALRALTQCGLCLVVASKEPLINIVGELGKTSGFFNVFRQCILNPFTAKEAEYFVQAKGDQARFTDQERQRLLDYGQIDGAYWPIRLQLVGELLLDDKILAIQENDPARYHPTDPAYWQDFAYRVEECYRGAVR